ncbi:MAG: VTT domain-containing protein [Prevotellaceae bacterium]|jgi:membrane protein YqaA with SNARE-associated domain|nr:VTT domain-containing protein [Prevotellaceae bacterium]
MITFITWGYIGLFVASFLAATILPFCSEVVFSTLVYNGSNPWICLAVATVGNWLGGLTCYWIGWLGKITWIEKWLRIPKSKIDRFMHLVGRYGNWLAFFSFLPWVGDAIAVAAGLFRCRLWIVAVSMLFGKFVRYAVWMYLNSAIF